MPRPPRSRPRSRSRKDAAPPRLPFSEAENGRPGVEPVDLAAVTEERYRNYALSVIGARALPDVRDGLKPVQRRILLTMWRQRLVAGRRFRKCAKVVGDVMGAYHPHGDAAIYEALVRMAQPFSSRLPLVEGSGNFGSLDGDPPAAMRYTECRLAEMAGDVLEELNAGAVDSRPNYDGSRTEPVVLPTRLPLLLVNGSTGIAVGVATNIPPHNLIEVLDALIALLDQPELTSGDLVRFVRGPDFPTGGEILESERHLKALYRKGKGSLQVRGTMEEAGVRRQVRTLFITSVPWGVNKAQLVSRLAAIAADRSFPQLLDVSDLSTDDVRIRLDVRKDVEAGQVVAFLARKTPFQSSVPVDLTCLRFEDSPGGAPEQVGLKTLLADFLGFRREVTRRRLENEAGKLRKQLHILDGFRKVFDVLDRVLAVVRGSKGKKDAARRIMAELPLDAEQTDAVLELRVYRLARLEIRVVLDEARDRRKRLGEVERQLGSAQAIRQLVRDELAAVREARRAAHPRLTRLTAPDTTDYAEEDFILAEEAVLILSRHGWLRRQREVKDPTKLRMRQGDAVQALAPGSTRAAYALFSSFGTAFTGRIAQVPAGRGYGGPVQTLFALADGERIVTLLGLDPRRKLPEHGLALTRAGSALRFRLAGFAEPSNRNGRRFLRLREGDEVLGVAPAGGGETLILATRSGRVLLVPVEEVPVLRGPGMGSRVVMLGEGDAVLGFRLARGREGLRAETPGGQVRLIDTKRFRVGKKGRRGRQAVKAGFVRVLEDRLTAPVPLAGPP